MRSFIKNNDKNDCLSDLFLFKENKEEFIENFIASEIADFLNMNKKSTKNSITKWTRRSIEGVQ